MKLRGVDGLGMLVLVVSAVHVVLLLAAGQYGSAAVVLVITITFCAVFAKLSEIEAAVRRSGCRCGPDR